MNVACWLSSIMNSYARNCTVVGLLVAGAAFSRVDTPLPALRRFSVFHLVAGDFDGDGLDDLVVGHRAVHTGEDDYSVLTVLLGRGDGTFEARAVPTHLGSNGVSGLLAADLDRDGRLDLVVKTLDSDGARYVAILLGRGDGGFHVEHPTHLAGDYASGLAVADMNGDGVPDVIVGDSEPNPPRQHLDIYPGRGDGTFDTRLTFRDPAVPLDLVAGDFDGDGKQDVLVIMSDDDGTRHLDVLRNDGSGGLSRLVSYPMPSARIVVAADLNADGILDAVTGGQRGNAIHVLLGRGDGTFSPDVPYPVDVGPVSIAVGDVNGDGAPDLLTVTATSGPPGRVSVLLGAGDGTFSAGSALPSGDDPIQVLPLNVDGRCGQEIAIANREPAGVTVLFPR